MQILVLRDGQQLGPFSREDFENMLAAGEVGSEEPAWCEGEEDWIPAQMLLSRWTNAPAIAPAAATAPTSAMSIISCVLGLLSVLCLLTPLGIPAVICGHSAFSAIRKSGGLLQGKGFAAAGLVTGYIGIIGTFVLALVVVNILQLDAQDFFGGKDVAAATRSLGQAKRITIACQQYAASRGGAFPESLEDLAPDYVQKETLIDPANPSEAIGYHYFGAGRVRGSGPFKLLESKKIYGTRRAIASSDGVFTIERVATGP